MKFRGRADVSESTCMVRLFEFLSVVAALTRVSVGVHPFRIAAHAVLSLGRDSEQLAGPDTGSVGHRVLVHQESKRRRVLRPLVWRDLDFEALNAIVAQAEDGPRSRQSASQLLLAQPHHPDQLPRV